MARTQKRIHAVDPWELIDIRIVLITSIINTLIDIVLNLVNKVV